MMMKNEKWKTSSGGVWGAKTPLYVDTYPQCPKGVVGVFCLIFASSVHQPLQLHQKELLGSERKDGIT